MSITKFASRTLLLLVVLGAMTTVLACGGADEATSETTESTTTAPSTSVTTAPTAAPVAKVEPTKAPDNMAGQAAVAQPTVEVKAPSQPVVMEKPAEAFKYVAPPQQPGVYWDFVYRGPRPTEFSENPLFAEMVKAGQLPPVEERLPEEIKVVQGPDGIGEYGGRQRITSTGGGPSNRMYWDKKNANEIEHLPHVGFYEISDDGRVYTFRNRKGLNWSDGTPMTMEDIRFAWEDVNLNKTLHETPQTQWIDSVTGEIIKFAIIDDDKWTLTWDTPDFTLMEGEVRPGSRCTSFYFCFYAPAHYMKQFHEDHADADKLKAIIQEYEAGDWLRLWGVVNNHGTHVEMPVMGPFVLTSQSDTLSTWRTNPFFFEVDPEGNQLPYLDGVDSLRVESREVGVFRSMAGETDLHGRDFRLEELPLYRSNMGRGDFNIKLWPLPGPGDMGMIICQTCNQDPETGKWMRSIDFRNALSLAMDRNSINDTVFLGLGVEKNWVPHPSTPYYPGDDAAFHNTEYDPDKANEILDGLGLTERDAEGFRLRSDGSGERLSFLNLAELNNGDKAAELMVDYFAQVGIDMPAKPMNAPWTLTYPGKEAISTLRVVGNYGANPWFSSWTRCCATGAGPAFVPDIGDLPRSMKRGPNGAVPMEGGYQPRCDCEQSPDWKPTAPDHTYPADPTGTIDWLNQNWHKGKGFERLSPDRVEIGKEVFRLHAEEKYYNILIAHSGFWRGTIINRNNFLNAPETHVADVVGWYGELYYFADGIDNIRN